MGVILSQPIVLKSKSNQILSSMEESEFAIEFKFMNFIFVQTHSLFVSPLEISSHPLFSFTVTLCTLILLYLPRLFWKIILSPVIILTIILLMTILRFGANQRSQKRAIIVEEAEERKDNESSNLYIETTEESNSLHKVHQWITDHSETELKSQMGFSSECFVESWEVKAPLEVIYEEYDEGEEAEEDHNEKEENKKCVDSPKYPLLSQYYRESESGSESESSSESGFPAIGRRWSPENGCFEWEEEDKEGLIEIALDGGKKMEMEFQFEEDNLIEIDISPTRHDKFYGEIN